MRYLRTMRIFSLAAMFALVMGAAFAERSFAQTMVEITAADLKSDTTMTAQDKVNAKIAASTVEGGTVVSFPSGEFKDVGEIQVFGKSGTAPSGSGATAVAAKYITLRGSGTVFTGKIMINVQASKYVVIEDFTFRDTQPPDMVTVTPGATSGDKRSTIASIAVDRHASLVEEDTGVVWLNTVVAATSAACSTNTAMKPLTNITVRNNVFMNTVRHGILARAKNALLDALQPTGFHAVCDSSAVTITGNRFEGIGLGANAVYLDAAKTIPGYQNRESAIEGDKTYGWTVTYNMIGVTADGMDAKGTTANGIRLDRAFGKTVVSNNTVNNTAWSGIVVGGDGSTGTLNVEDADEAEITIARNKVTNSRNDPYVTSTVGPISLMQFPPPNSETEGYYQSNWRFGLNNGYFARTTPSTRSLPASTPWFGSTTKQTIDDLFDVRVCALGSDISSPPLPFTKPYLGPPGSCRRVSSILSYTGEPIIDGGGAVVETQPGRDNALPGGRTSTYPRLRWLRPGLEAGLELNRLTAKTITVEGNELTNNVVGLAVCPSIYCYAADPFPNIAFVSTTVNTPLYYHSIMPRRAGTLKVPTVRNNSIYDNRKRTAVPDRFVRADVINALTVTNAGTGKNLIVLAGNYLGDNPEVRGAVNTDDLADAAPENVGPRETDEPGLAATGGAALSGTTITLTYDEALDDESVPAAAAFTVTQTASGGFSGTIAVSRVAVSGMSVTLTLARAPGSGNSVTVSYDPTKAGSGTGIGPIQDSAGNEAPALTSRTVTVSTPTTDPDPDPMPMPAPQPAAAADDGGCALASGGSGGTDLGMLLAMMVAPLAFGLRRRVKEAG